MICPKCEIGTVISVILKVGGEVAQLCDYCETIWMQGEDVNANTGHDFAGIKGEDIEYSLDEPETQDQDHRSALFPNINNR